MRALLVDDDEDIRRTLVAVAGQLRPPVQMDTAQSAAEAMRMAGLRPYDAVLADRHMPDMPGDELLAWFRAHHPEVRRIMITGSLELHHRNGIQAFLAKPFSIEQLRDALAQVPDRAGEPTGDRLTVAGSAPPAPPTPPGARGRPPRPLRPLRRAWHRLKDLLRP